VQIDELEATIESCRKFILAGRIAVASGGVVLFAMLVGGIQFNPSVMGIAGAERRVLRQDVGSMARGAKPMPARDRTARDRRAVLHGRGRPDSRTRVQRPKAVRRQHPREKRRLLNFLLSNCSWEDGEVVATFRQPFDFLAQTNAVAMRSETGLGSESAKSEIWLGN
jgi:hypothetical protein